MSVKRSSQHGTGARCCCCWVRAQQNGGANVRVVTSFSAPVRATRAEVCGAAELRATAARGCQRRRRTLSLRRDSSIASQDQRNEQLPVHATQCVSETQQRDHCGCAAPSFHFATIPRPRPLCCHLSPALGWGQYSLCKRDAPLPRRTVQR